MVKSAPQRRDLCQHLQTNYYLAYWLELSIDQHQSGGPTEATNNAELLNEGSAGGPMGGLHWLPRIRTFLNGGCIQCPQLNHSYFTSYCILSSLSLLPEVLS